MLDVDEIIAAHEFDGECLAVAGLAVIREIFDVIEDMLGGDAVGREQGDIGEGKEGGGGGTPGPKPREGPFI